MPEYTMPVSFAPVLHKTMDTAVSTQLKTPCKLADLDILPAPEAGGPYKARVRVAAGNVKDAWALAINRVREALMVLGTVGEAYELLYESKPAVESVSEEESAAVVRTEEGVSTRQGYDGGELSEHAAVVQTRESIDKQSEALQHSAEWPAWLRVALELNYMAVTARELRPALVTRYSALEVIVTGTQGKPRVLLKSALGKRRADQVAARLEAVLQAEELQAEQVKRVVEQARNAHSEGVQDRILRTLAELDVGVAPGDLELVIKRRGRIVHTTNPPSDNEVLEACNKLTPWVQSALQELLRKYV